MYSKLDKDLKKKAKQNFMASNTGKNTKNRFIRIYISIILLLLYSLYLLIFSDTTWIEYYLGIISFVSAIIIFLFSIKVKRNLINEFLNTDKNASN